MIKFEIARKDISSQKFVADLEKNNLTTRIYDVLFINTYFSHFIAVSGRLRTGELEILFKQYGGL